jgi:hypothetical protein
VPQATHALLRRSLYFPMAFLNRLGVLLTSGKTGALEYWSPGVLEGSILLSRSGFSFLCIIHHSITPLLQYPVKAYNFPIS